MRVCFGWLIPALVAGACVEPALAVDAQDVLPAGVHAFASSEHAAGGSFGAPEPLDAASHFERWADNDATATGAPPSYLPIVYSALVPGLGELTMGYRWRGIALIALDVASWTGYFVKHQDGLDKRADYEAFADAHWDFDRWIENHPCSTVPPGATLEDVEKCGRDSSGSGAWPGYIPYVSKAEDKQHYYENIGKYDWYISGWEDWDYTQIPYPHQTDLRTQYRAMRGESNHALDSATSFVWVSVAARAFSVVETAIIVHKRRGDSGGAGEPAPVALRARPRGTDGGELALEVSFK